MLLQLLSGFLLVLTPVIVQGQWTDVCAELCQRLSYEGEPESCMTSCETLFEAQTGQEIPSNYYDNYADVYDEGQNVMKRGRQSGFVRIGRHAGQPDPRAFKIKKQKSAFVRIGRSADTDTDLLQADTPMQPTKRASSFVRIGRNRLFRLYNNDKNYKRTSNFVRIGKKSIDEDNKRVSGFVRIGRPSSFVRIGKSSPGQLEEERRASGFVRIGRPGSGFVRIGKSSDEPLNKRASSFVRIGKSSQGLADEDRKRTSAFVRIGKKNDGYNGSADKRASAFVRIGKSMNDDEKRASSFIGKSAAGIPLDFEIENSIDPDDIDRSAEQEKRASSFVRIGKRDAE